MSNFGDGWDLGTTEGHDDARMQGEFLLDEILARVNLKPQNHFLNGYVAGYRLAFASDIIKGKAKLPLPVTLEHVITSGGPIVIMGEAKKRKGRHYAKSGT